MGRFGRRRVGAPGGGARLSGYGAETFGDAGARTWQGLEQSADLIADTFARYRKEQQRREREEQLEVAKAEQESRDTQEALEAAQTNRELVALQKEMDAPGYVPPEGEIVGEPGPPVTTPESRLKVEEQLLDAELEAEEQRRELELERPKEESKVLEKEERIRDDALTQVEKYIRKSEERDDRVMRMKELYAAQQDRALTAQERAEFYQLQTQMQVGAGVEKAADFWQDDSQVYARAKREVDREMKELEARGRETPVDLESHYRNRMNALRVESGWFTETAGGLVFDGDMSPARAALEEKHARAPRTAARTTITAEDLAEAQKIRFRLPREMRDWKVGMWQKAGVSGDWASRMAARGLVERRALAASGRTLPVDPELPSMGISGSSAAPAPPRPISERPEDTPNSSPLRQEEVEDAMGDAVEDQLVQGQVEAEADADAILSGQVPPEGGPEPPDATMAVPGVGAPPPTLPSEAAQTPGPAPPAPGAPPSPVPPEGSMLPPSMQALADIGQSAYGLTEDAMGTVFGGIQDWAASKVSDPDSIFYVGDVQDIAAESNPDVIAAKEAAAEEAAGKMEAIWRANPEMANNPGVALFLMSRARDRDHAAKLAEKEADYLAAQQKRVEDLLANEKMAPEAKAKSLETLLSRQEEQHYGKEVAAIKRHARKLVRSYVEQGMDQAEAIEKTQDYVATQSEMLKRRAISARLTGEADEWNAAYEQLAATLSDPKEMGKFMIQTGVPMVVATATGAAGLGIAARMAAVAYSSAATSAMLSDESVFREDGSIDWNVVQGHMAEGASNVLEVPFMDALRAFPSKIRNRFLRSGLTRVAGAVLEGTEEPIQELVGGLLKDGTLATPGELAVAATLGSMMGAGMGGMVADRNSLVNRLAALKESNPELFEEGVEVTPESLEASIAAALEGPVDVTPRIAAEAAGERVAEAVEVAPDEAPRLVTPEGPMTAAELEVEQDVATAEEAVEGELERLAKAAEPAAADVEEEAPTTEEVVEAEKTRATEQQKAKAEAAVTAMRQIMPKQEWTQDPENPNVYRTEVKTPQGMKPLEMRLGEDYIEVSAAALRKHGLTPEEAAKQDIGAAGKHTPKLRLKDADIIRVLKNEGAETVAHEVLHFYRSNGLVSAKDWATLRMKYEAKAKATIGEGWASLSEEGRQSAVEEHVAKAFGIYAEKRTAGRKMTKAPGLFKRMYENLRQFGVALKGGDQAVFDKLLRQDTKGESRAAELGAKASAALRRFRASNPKAAGKVVAVSTDGESAAIIPLRRPEGDFATEQGIRSAAFAFEVLHGDNSNAGKIDHRPEVRRRALKQMKATPSDQERLGIKPKKGDRPTWTRIEVQGAQPVIVQYAHNDADPDDPMIVGLVELAEDGSIAGIAGGRVVSGQITNADPLYAAAYQMGASHSGTFMPAGQEAYQKRMLTGKGVYDVDQTDHWFDWLREKAPKHADVITRFQNGTGTERQKIRTQYFDAIRAAIGTGLEIDASQQWPHAIDEGWVGMAQDVAEQMELSDAEIDQLLSEIEPSPATESLNIKVLERIKGGETPVLDTDTKIGPTRGRDYPAGHPKYRKGKPLRRPLTKAEQIAKFFDEETVAQIGALTGYSNEALKKDPALRARVFDRVVAQAQEEMQHSLDEDEKGREWYGKSIKAMEDILRTERPEFSGADGDTNMGLFKALLAITSTGNKVRDNAKMALEMWDTWQDGGEFPLTRQSGEKWGRTSIAKQVGLLGALIQKHGPEKTLELLRKPMSYDEIVKTFGRKPSDITKGGAPGFQYYGSHIFGPKLGAFFQNLDGNFQPLTADLWWSRSFNRWLGLMFDRDANGDIQWKVKTDPKTGRRKVIPSWHETPRGFNERAFMQDVARNLAEEFDMDTASAQAVLWYYEQRLWDQMGAAVDPEVSYDAAIGQLFEAERAAGAVAAEVGEDAAAVGTPARAEPSGEEDLGVAERGESAALTKGKGQVSDRRDLLRRITKRSITRLKELVSPDGRRVGEHLGKQIEDRQEFIERKTSLLGSQFRKALAAYKKRKGKDWEEGWEQVRLALDGRQVNPAKLGGPEKALYTVTRAILNTAKKDAIEAQTFSGQAVRHYFPHMRVGDGTFDYDELIDRHAEWLSRPENEKYLSKLQKEDAEWMAGLTGEASVRDLAAMDLGRNFNKETFWRSNPNLEKHRSGAMTDYAKTPEVIEQYLLTAYTRIGSGRYLGPQSQVVMAGLKGLSDVDRQLARDVVRDAMGKPREPGYLGGATASAARELGALNGLAKLGMAALPQITQTAAASSEAVGATGFFKGLADIGRAAGGMLLHGRRLIEDAERSGATYAATANEAMQAYAGTGNRTVVERMFTQLFNLGGLVPAVTGKDFGKRIVGSTYFVRDLDKFARVYANRLGQLAYLRALESQNVDVLTDLMGTRELAETALREDGGRVQELRGLLESGRGGEVTFLEEMARPPQGEPRYPGKTAGLAAGMDRIDRAGKRFADKTQYRTRSTDMPVGFNHPVVKAMNTFYSFHYQHWRWNVEHAKALREAQKKGDKKGVARHARTLMAHHLMMAPIIGYGSLILRSFLTGRGAGEEEHEWDESAGTFFTALDKVMGLSPLDPRVNPGLAALQAWQFSGGIGYPLATLERGMRAYQKGQRDFGRAGASFVGGAPGETIYDTSKLTMMALTVSAKWANGTLKKSEWDAFKRQMVRQSSHMLPNPFGITGGVRRELTKSDRWPVESPGWWGLVFDPQAYWDPQYGVTSPAYQAARKRRRRTEKKERQKARRDAAASWRKR